MKNNPHYSAYTKVFLVSVLVILSLLANPVMALRNSAPDESLLLVYASNDNFADAMVIDAIPFHNPVSFFDATAEATDPQTSLCTNAPGLATVWYKYTPSANVIMHMDTIGSTYDTTMVLYTYDGSTLTEVACNDDAGGVGQSALNKTLTAGVTYYILVSQFNNVPPDAGMGKSSAAQSVGEVVSEGNTHMFRMVLLQKTIYKSVRGFDGYVVESTETSGVGQLKNSTLPYVQVGDDMGKRQYKAILSFDTSGMPDDAMVASAVLKVKRKATTAGNVFMKLGYLQIFIRNPYFGNSNALEVADFSSAGTYAGRFPKFSSTGWFQASLGINSLASVNRTGQTQYRLQFMEDDSNDTVADFIRFFSGDSTIKPSLILRYYIP